MEKQNYLYEYRLNYKRIKGKETNVDKVQAPNEVYKHLTKRLSPFQESFYVIALNSDCKTIGFSELFKGDVQRAVIDVRLIFSFLLTVPGCVSFIVAHNHPTGNLYASEQDKSVKKKLESAGELMGIKMVDFIIFNEDDWQSDLY